uniref:G-protein coupled receptors family 1 profile domain-containing protein n=1 Tax=Ascaris lumbricoides TaxID=6252 RepID=A0A9J2PZ19_ASCLU
MGRRRRENRMYCKEAFEAELHNPSRIVYLLFIIIRWALSAFIIILSRKIIAHDIIKYFTLNLIATCILCDMFLAARECIAVAQLYTTVFHSSQTLVLFNALTQVFADAAATEYRAMSLFVVFTMYLLFVFPFKMRQFLSGKAYKYYFISVHLLTPFACLSRFLIYIVRDQYTLAVLRRYNAIGPYALVFTVAVLLLLITLLVSWPELKRARPLAPLLLPNESAPISWLARPKAVHKVRGTLLNSAIARDLKIGCVVPVHYSVCSAPFIRVQKKSRPPENSRRPFYSIEPSAITLWMHDVLPEQMTYVLSNLRFSCEGELFIIEFIEPYARYSSVSERRRIVAAEDAWKTTVDWCHFLKEQLSAS